MAARFSRYIIILMMVVVSSSCLKEKPLTMEVSPGWYTINTEKPVRCNKGIKGNSPYIFMAPGNQVYVLGPADIFGKELYAKVKHYGTTYYIPFNTLEFYATEIPDNKQYLGESPFQYNNPKAYLLFVIIALTIAYFMPTVSGIWYLIISLSLPLSIIVYLNGTLTPLWMCEPSRVYIPVVIVSMFSVLIIMTLLASMVKHGFSGIFKIFSNPIGAIVSLAMMALSLLALMSIVATFVEEDLWLAVLMIFAFVPKSWVYLGSFTNSKGRSVDVFLLD